MTRAVPERPRDLVYRPELISAEEERELLEELAITLVRGAGEGAVFALVAMSLNIVFNASDVLNFAQGYFVILGGLFTSTVLNLFLVPPLYARFGRPAQSGLEE